MTAADPGDFEHERPASTEGAASTGERSSLDEMVGDGRGQREHAAAVYDELARQSEHALRAAHPDDARLHAALDESARLRASVAERRAPTAHPGDPTLTPHGGPEVTGDRSTRAATSGSVSPSDDQADGARRIAAQISAMLGSHASGPSRYVSVTIAERVVTVVMDDTAPYGDEVRDALITVVERELGETVDVEASGSHRTPVAAVEVLLLHRP